MHTHTHLSLTHTHAHTHTCLSHTHIRLSHTYTLTHTHTHTHTHMCCVTARCVLLTHLCMGGQIWSRYAVARCFSCGSGEGLWLMALSPAGVVETDGPLKYEGTFGNTVSGKLEGGVGQMNVNLEGKGMCNLQFSFGNLKKQKVDICKLLEASRDRMLNLKHGLLRQVQGRGRGRGQGRGRQAVLTVLKERIVSTQSCSISQQVQGLGSCSAMLSLIAPTNVKVSVQENGSLQKDCSISLEIPEGTVLAYSVMELHVHPDGQYELCLQPDTLGGCEVDGPIRGSEEEWGPKDGEQPISILQKELSALQAHFQCLATLPAPTRSSLFRNLQQVLHDRPAVSVLQNAVEELMEGGPCSLKELEELTPCQQQWARGVLDLLQNAPPPSPALLTSVHLLLSAVEEMSDAGLVHLSTCCSPTVLKSLQDLVNGGMVNGESALADEGVCQRAELLFSSSNMVLKMGRLEVESGAQPGLRPLFLCIAVQGLATLCTGL
ncbi:gasdermin-E-like [Anguilla rostrata]|uniref:gasdermin-E-like n=1 Tax=Anguilla rostrata TaxID=7938 RepID=UPI0030D32A09